MADMGINSLKNNVTNPARTYLWEVIFANPLGGNTDTLLLRARSTSIPGRSVGDIHLPYKGTGGVEYPGKLTFPHDWSCTFVESEDGKTWNALYDWSQKIVNAETGTSGLIIKTDVYLNLLNTDGSSRDKIKLVGAYIKNIADVALDYGGEALVNIVATWRYDYWVKVE
jgi:hypothetical protein